jgi:type IV pilus assembly protein PilC
MIKFKYKIQNSGGQIIESVAEAPDKFTLAHDLIEKGNIPLVIREYKEKTKGLSHLDIFSGVSLQEKMVFITNLSGMLSAGLSLPRAIAILEKQTKNMAFKTVLTGIVDDINKGLTLSEGMKRFPKVFSTVFVSMVHAGEESGSLPSTLAEVGMTLKKTYDLNKKIKGALMYPSIIISAIILIGILMMIFVVPTLTKTFKELGGELPTTTKFIIWVSDSLSQHTLTFVILMIGFIAGAAGLIRAKFSKKYIDSLVLKIPVIGNMIKEVNAARTARTLSSLLTSGVDVARSLAITEEVLQNMYYKKVIHDAAESVQKGQVLSLSFKSNTHLYPIMMGEMIEVGEETGKLSKMLIDVATFYENEVDNKTKDLSTIIEPVLMVFVGGAVGFFAISMISPIYGVMNNIK